MSQNTPGAQPDPAQQADGGAQQAPAAPVYESPAQSQVQEQPVQQQPEEPQAQEPSMRQPMQEPMQAPMQAPQSYGSPQAPVYSAPQPVSGYQPPVYQAPQQPQFPVVYEAPQAPVYAAPQAPTYAATAYGAQQQTYGVAYGYAGPVEPKGMVIAGMALGIGSLVFFWVWWLGLPAAIVGLVLSIVGMKKGQPRGMAIAGIICAGISLLFVGIGVILAVLFFASLSGMSTFG